jgi:MerR family mercuric resistance operon transcriptional regulator
MEKHPTGMAIGTMAKTAGVNVETVRFYQRKGLISKPRRVRGEIAHYTFKDVGRVKFVKAAQRLGFTLEEVRALLDLEDGKHCCEVRDIARLKLHDVRERIAALQSMELALENLIDGCQTTERSGVCHLIAALQANA